ncbi:hypothetical protein EB118_15935 [bacterium]|nr:hypothetical protein [bacterium]
MAIKTNLIVDQGSTFVTTLALTDANNIPIDLNLYTFSGQLRKHYTSSNSVSFTVTGSGNTGVLTLSLSANATANIVAGRYVYDVEIVESSSSNVTRVVEGIVTVTPNVTR